MKLYDLLDTDLLVKHAHNHLVGAQRHPTLPLRIYNYTQHAQFEGDWRDGTLAYCRGLIVDDDDNIISRPFPKFHNLNTLSVPDTLEINLPKTTPTILEKLDGSLGILWQFDDQYGVATRGSFTSPQAVWATKWLTDRVQGRVGGAEYAFLPRGDDYTWLFEIIYNENRIVVQYPYEGLVLIGMIDRATGQERPHHIVKHIGERDGFRVAQRIEGRNIHDCMQDNIPNEEGYVVTYNLPLCPPLKVKIKMADYVRLHKIVTGMNARSVWELLSEGKSLDEFVTAPENFKRWLSSWANKLTQEHDDILQRSINAYDKRPYRWVTNLPTEELQDREYRAKFAKFVSEQPVELRSVLFAMLDKKDPSVLIWKSIKPRGDDQTFRTEGE